MKEEDSERVAELVEAALERPPAEWPALLEAGCGGDENLRAEVEALLRLQGEVGDFIETPVLARNEAEALFAGVGARVESEGGSFQEGEMVDKCRIISLLGVGGMGEVYLADDTELGRRVALKFLRRELGAGPLLRRFRHEERILAGLNYPHIAQLYGSAVSPDGLPYFIMEYVEGERLDTYCQARQLTIDARLALFRQVCSAVTYAHQNLVIHRDLKPANIRVTPAGQPKLLDFGIAKLLDPDGTKTQAGALATMTLSAAMTPEYASPEQIRGGTITTASDVYSLGVILYELLTGQRPFAKKQQRPDELARAICEEEPARPSTVIVPGENHSPFTNHHSQLLRGDLDNIVQMALRKEPERRYASVSQFSEDLRCHLAGLPVIACRDTWSYRSAKFIRRNKTAVAAAIFIALALVGGIVATAWQARVASRERDRAQRRFADVRRLSNALLFDIAPKMERLEGSTEARKALVVRALEYLDSLAREAGDDPQLQGELAAAYEKVGELQGAPRNANLGDFAGATVSYQKARDIRRRLLAKNPRDLAETRRLAANLSALSFIRWWTGELSESLADTQNALQLYDQLLSLQPGSADLRLAAANSQIDLAHAYYFNDQLAEVYPPLKKALATLEILRQADPENPEILRLLGRGETILGITLSWDGKQKEGEAEMAKAFALNEALAARFPHDNVIQQSLLSTYIQGAQLYEEIDDAHSFDIRLKAREIAAELVRRDPANMQARQSLAKTDAMLGVIAVRLKRPAEAIDYLGKSSRAFAELKTINPHNRTYDPDAAKVVMYRGLAEALQHQYSEALASYAEAVGLFEEQARADPRNNFSVRKLVNLHTYIGETQREIANQFPAGADQQNHRRMARENYLTALDLLHQLEARQALTDYDRKDLEQLQIAVQQ